jgi:hypothetical protein
MDQQQKAGDNPVETIAKTIPGEFVSLMVLLKSFLANQTQLILLGIIVSVLVPIYATKVLKIASLPQKIVMYLSFLAWLFMLVPEGVDNLLGMLLSTQFSFAGNVTFLAAIVIVLQFATPFLTKPSAPAVTPAPPSPPKP